MAFNGHNAPAAPGERRQRIQLFPLIRLILAWIVTFVVLLYAWGRALVMWMMDSGVELQYLVMLIGGILAVIGLTWNLSAAWERPGINRLVHWGVPLSWIGTGVVVVLTNTGDLFPKYLSILIFVPATLWVLWFSWMFYQSIPWAYRLGVLIICWGFLVGCITALEVQGLTGDAKVNFAWRWQNQNNGLATAELHSPPSRAGENIDLTKISSDDYPQFLGPQRL
ncbi:MAG TPA: hypothetical protein VGY77_05070, partial [Gemmataceae bacterium]|nr:hypothetical protein [Gemmataceae bacterium]